MRCIDCGSAVELTQEDYSYDVGGYGEVVLAGISVWRCPACKSWGPRIHAIELLHEVLMREKWRPLRLSWCGGAWTVDHRPVREIFLPDLATSVDKADLDRVIAEIGRNSQETARSGEMSEDEIRTRLSRLPGVHLKK